MSPPRSCPGDGSCGSLPDGCGGVLSCGCSEGAECIERQCAAPPCVQRRSMVSDIGHLGRSSPAPTFMKLSRP